MCLRYIRALYLSLARCVFTIYTVWFVVRFHFFTTLRLCLSLLLNNSVFSNFPSRSLVKYTQIYSLLVSYGISLPIKRMKRLCLIQCFRPEYILFVWVCIEYMRAACESRTTPRDRFFFVVRRGSYQIQFLHVFYWISEYLHSFTIAIITIIIFDLE